MGCLMGQCYDDEEIVIEKISKRAKREISQKIIEDQEVMTYS